MTDALTIAMPLGVAAIADPLALPTAQAGDAADPFAEMLAVLAGPPAAATVATVAAPMVPDVRTLAGLAASSAAEADAPVAGASGESPAEASGDMQADDGTIDNGLAASLSAMLAIAPPPPLPRVPLVAPPAPEPSAKGRGASIAAVPAAATDPANSGQITPQGAAPTADASPEPTEPAGQFGRAPLDAAAALPAAGPSASEPTASPDPDQPVAAADPTARGVSAPIVPAAILRLLREAPTAAARPGIPAGTANSRDAIAAQGVAPTGRDGRLTATRPPPLAVARPPSAKTARAAEALDPVALPFAETRVAGSAADATSAPVAVAGDMLVQGQLAMARDGQWLDTLARDIAASATGRDLHFRLAPESLGALTVSIVAQTDGAAIRMTADTDRAHAILTEAQPRLVAEARAQGLRISETHVELNNDRAGNGSGASAWDQAGGQPGGQAQPQGDRRQTSSPNRLPLQPNLTTETSAAPAQKMSERYA